MKPNERIAQLTENIVQWAIDRKIIDFDTNDQNKYFNYAGQLTKRVEELNELSIAYENKDVEGIKDGIGDFYVTCVNSYATMSVYTSLESEVTDKDSMLKNLESVLANWSLSVNSPDINIIDNPFPARVLSVFLPPVIYTYCLIPALQIIADKFDLQVVDCIEHAWNEIKDRKGQMVNGIFVKEA